MKVEMYFLLLVILTATVMNCGQGKTEQIDFYSHGASLWLKRPYFLFADAADRRRHFAGKKTPGASPTH